MIVPVENKCFECKRIFCCPQCRIKHEKKIHANISCPSCSLCTGHPMTLQRKHSKEMLQHLVDKHVPLSCNKCSKVFTGAADFLAVTACKLESKGSCHLRSYKPSAEIIDSGKCNPPPMIASTDAVEKNAVLLNDNHVTPVAHCNVRWNSKVGSDLLTDSISSIRNASSLLNNTSSAHIQSIQVTQSPNGKNNKLVRQTSTPMHRSNSLGNGSVTNIHGLKNRKPGSFDSINSSEQMSSIYTPNQTTGSDCSPNQESSGRASPPVPKTSRLRKKMPVAATPLRQVMSRSIQKAMVQHGLPSKLIPYRIPNNPSVFWSPASTPLDLRTSPVIRRTVSLNSDSSQSEFDTPELNHHITKPSHKNDENPMAPVEDVVSAYKPHHYNLVDSIYESCKSFDVQEAESQTNPLSTTAALPISSSDQTPKTSGVLMKSNSFAERRAAQRPSFYNEDEETGVVCTSTTTTLPDGPSCGKATIIRAVVESSTADDDTLEQWFTPCAKPAKSTITVNHPVAFTLSDEDDSAYTDEADASDPQSGSNCTTDPSEDENVFYDNVNEVDAPSVQSTTGGLWSLVSSVMRLASFGQLHEEQPKVGISLLKRCATYAGRMTSFDGGNRAGSGVRLVEQAIITATNKRRRTKTSGSQAEQSPTTANVANKIMGRPPLKRMRRVLAVEN